MATHVPTALPRVVERFPFFLSTPEERRKLFGPEGRVGFGEKITTTAKLAQQLRERLAAEHA